MYVPLDMELSVPSFSSSTSLAMQIIGFESDKPIFKVGDAAYEGRWEDMVGTEIYTDIDGNVFTKGRERIKAVPVVLTDKNEGEGAKQQGGEQQSEFQKRLAQLTEERSVRENENPNEEDVVMGNT